MSESKYKEEYCDYVLELGRDGASYAKMALAIGINRDTLYEWMKAHPEFKEAMVLARQAAMVWWEDQAQRGMTNRDFQSRVLEWMMSNQFPQDYRHRTETDITTDGQPLTVVFGSKDDENL